MITRDEYNAAIKVVKDYRIQVHKEYLEIKDDSILIEELIPSTLLQDIDRSLMPTRLYNALTWPIARSLKKQVFEITISDCSKIPLHKLRKMRGFGSKAEKEYIRILILAGISPL